MLPSSGHERDERSVNHPAPLLFLLLLPLLLLLLLAVAAVLHGDVGLARVAVEPHVRFRPLPHKHARPCRRLGVARLDWGAVVALEAGVEIWVAVAARPPGAQPAEGRAGGASNSTSSSNNKASR